MRMTDMPERLARFGVPYVEVNGWQGRGSDMHDTLVGGINHHTAGAAHGVTPSMGTVINGRPDLSGPLCNILLGRDHVAYLIAAGKGNHAGRGNIHGYSASNSELFGLEVEHVGTSAEPTTPELIEAMARVQAAMAFGRYPANNVLQHWEFATPAGRKSDFYHGPGGVDADAFRARVSELLTHGVTPPPPEQWNLGTFPGVTLKPGMTVTSDFIRKSIRDYKFALTYLGFKVDMNGLNAYKYGTGTAQATIAVKKLYFGATGQPVPANLGGDAGPTTWNWVKLMVADKNNKH